MYKIFAAIRYAEHFIGLPYKWGGSNPVDGMDCSGFVQAVLQSVGIDPPGDQTAQALFAYFSKEGQEKRLASGCLLFFGADKSRISHIALAVNEWQMIEAGGGDSTTKTVAEAARQNAYVRIRPVANRSDLRASIMPNKFLED